MIQSLPDKLSALIYLAVADLEKVEADPRYEINMGFWHSPELGMAQCSVCFAGAVMAGTLGAALKSEVVPSDFDLDTEVKLSALDEFRRGDKAGFRRRPNFVLSEFDLSGRMAGKVSASCRGRSDFGKPVEPFAGFLRLSSIRGRPDRLQGRCPQSGGRPGPARLLTNVSQASRCAC